jgi:hemolysin activation/secretion protein
MDGFMEGLFVDGAIMMTDMPNLLVEQQLQVESNSALRAQAKAEAKAKSQARAEAKAEAKAKAQAKAEAKAAKQTADQALDAAKATTGSVEPKSQLVPDNCGEVAEIVVEGILAGKSKAKAKPKVKATTTSMVKEKCSLQEVSGGPAIESDQGAGKCVSKNKLVEAKDKSYIVMMQEGKWVHAVSVYQKQTPRFKQFGSRLYDHAIQKQATKEELVSMRQTLLGELMDLH